MSRRTPRMNRRSNKIDTIVVDSTARCTGRAASYER